MIRLGARLALGGRDAVARFVVLAAAVALGVGLLLAALAGVNGLHAQAARGAWLDTSGQTGQCHGPHCVGAPDARSRPATLWWRSSVDQFESQAIYRIDVAPIGPGAPVPPGLSRLPGPGQFDVSPALGALLSSVPANELRDRYPGHEVGILGAAALPSPNSLIIVVGSTVATLAATPGAVEVRSILRSPADCYGCQAEIGSGRLLQWVLVGGAIALVLPVLILIVTASRLSAARREERFAAMRLVGATPRQISAVAAVEATIAATAGVAIGFALFFAFRSLLSHVPFTGAPLAEGDLSLNSFDVAIAAVGVPIAAAMSARLALRRVRISPLGVDRHVSSAPPRIARLVPLLGGIALLAYFDIAGKPAGNSNQLLETLLGFTLLVGGLVLAGPWLTTAGARLLARRAHRPATFLAARRLLDNPKGAFRFISGLVIALFVTSAAVGALNSIVAASRVTGDATGTVADVFCVFSNTNCPAAVRVPSVPAELRATLAGTRGVRAVTVVHASPVPLRPGQGSGVVACRDLAATPAIGACAPGTRVATVGDFLSHILGANTHASSMVWPSAHLTVAEATRLPVAGVVVATNGSRASIERARTALERAFPPQGMAVTVEQLDPSGARILAMVQDMIDVVVVASLLIAACSLAVNIAGGLGERKRPFSLLRLSGVPTGILHRVVAVESAVPLLVVAATSITAGLVASALYLHAQVDIAFSVPGVGYWMTVAAGLAASFLVIVSTFPLLDRITGPEVARST